MTDCSVDDLEVGNRAGAHHERVLDIGSEILVRVWPQERCDDTRLRKQVAAILPIVLDENQVVVIE